MKILSINQIREWDHYTIKNEPIRSIDLMERASEASIKWLKTRYGYSNYFMVFCGPGNNGGDGLAIARLLFQQGYHVDCYVIHNATRYSDDFLINKQRLENSGLKIKNINEAIDIAIPDVANTVVIDALFGSGLDRPILGELSTLIHSVNALLATTISIDIPSGLFADEDVNSDGAVILADHTLTFQVPKLSFFFPQHHRYTGHWHILDIGLDERFVRQAESTHFYLEEKDIKNILNPQNKFDHKGVYGHVLLIGGSPGKMGAAILMTNSCLRSGSGLVSTAVPMSEKSIMQTAIPEAMTYDIENVEDFEWRKFSGLAIGPGLGQDRVAQDLLDHVLDKYSHPLVIDADAINLVSANKDLLSKIPKGSILTPHPKEFERLSGEKVTGFKRLERQLEISSRLQCYIVLKGAHTCITTPEGQTYFNSTGNPGMATAGSGDVLTGIIASFLGQGYSPQEASLLGVFLHGRAGDIAAERGNQRAMLASDICNCLGMAFSDVE